MINVDFKALLIGSEYSRPELAEVWGYESYHAIARGVVTPAHGGMIVLFVTEEKQQGMEQYSDHLDGEVLHWEGPTDHFGEARMLAAANSDDEIHLFHRHRHHEPFRYLGQVHVEAYEKGHDAPSRFSLRITGG